MSDLSANQQAFITIMNRGEEYERHGYDLLLQEPDFESYFDALAEAGYFHPSRNSGPVEADKPGWYRLPYWTPLKYLEAVARRSGERNDVALADKIMAVVRAVSQWTDADGKPRDNENTWHAFGDIFGLVPTQAVTPADIDLIANWLNGAHTRSRLGPVFLGGPLKRFLASNDAADWAKAGGILFHCTTVRWGDGKWPREPDEKKAATIIDDYWLKKIIATHAPALGAKLGQEAVNIFVGRLREVFEADKYGDRSYWARPAVEDHGQNQGRDTPENRFVEGVRDTLYGWIDSDPEAASAYIAALLTDRLEMLRRIAIHMLDQRFDRLRALVLPTLTPDLFNLGQLHEVYLLLQNRFPEFSQEEKTATYNAILAFPEIEAAEDGGITKPAIQKRWLSAFAGKGHFGPADKLYAELNADKTLPGLFSHPEFHSYMEVRSGFGDSPFQVSELLQFAEDGVLIDKLNGFKPTNRWGPSIRSLSDTLIEAVSNKPILFAKLLPRFLDANRPYQYSIISGFQKLWGAWDGKTTPVLDWALLWPDLVLFFEKILYAEGFWTEAVGEHDTLEPTREWLPSTISEFLRAGTRDDEKAYDAALMQRTWKLVKALLKNGDPGTESETTDALNRAINTELGKAIEALFDHALRWCRLEDAKSKATGGAKSHKDIWLFMEPTFDEMLHGGRGKYFEFFALAGAYLSNVEYLDKDWFTKNTGQIFNIEHPHDTLCALDGLAYAPAVGSLYLELLKTGVIEWALTLDTLREHARENLLQRMGLAYFWDQDTLDSPRFSYLFDHNLQGDIEELGRFFWGVRGHGLSEQQVEKVLVFWDKCITWAANVQPTPAHLLSSLSLLCVYLSSIDARGKRLLLAVAPHVSVDYNADRLIEDLDRLSGPSPVEASEVLMVLLESHSPTYDFDGDLMDLIAKFGDNPDTRANALRSADKIRHLQGGPELFARLKNAQPKV